MKKIFKIISLSLLIFFILLLISKKTTNAFDFSFGMDNALKELMQQGNHIVCLDAETKKINVPSDWKKPAVGTVVLSGATCNSPSGCKIIRCNSSNSEIAANEHLSKICKTNPENWVGCKDEEKLKKMEGKTAASKQVKPGCEEVKNFSLISMIGKNINVLGTSTDGLLSQGPVNVQLDDSYVVHVDYQYYLSQPDDGTITDLGEGGEAITPGSENTQQIGTIGFSFTEKEVEGSIKDCDVISWDPFGRVFDSVSLEPMSDILVTLIDDKTKKPAIMKFNANSDFTDMRGIFNILVENEGTYSLDVEPPLTHTFSASAKLSPNYSKIYSDIYKPNGVFEEKINVPTHHDIPLQPIGEPYHGAVAELIEGSLKTYTSGFYVVYKGKVTYPFAKVCLVGSETNKIIGKCVNADKYGNYSISVHKSKIPMEFLEVSVRKVDLNNINNVYAEESREKGVGYEPLLSYIEGYAYDDNGNKLLNAKVAVRLKDNDKVFYETITDDTGLFIIYKNNLPFVDYYLEFVDSNQNSIKKTTSEFIFDNQQYLISKKINLILKTKNSKQVINDKTGNSNEIKNNLNSSIIKSKKTVVFNRYLLVILILVVLFIALLLTFLYFRKK